MVRKTFKIYIFGALILFALLVVSLFSIIWFSFSKKQIERELSNNYETTIKAISYYIDRIIDEKYLDLEFIASNFHLLNGLEDRRRLLLTPFFAIKSNIKYVLILNKEKIVEHVFPYSDEIVGMDLSYNPIVNNQGKYKIYGPYVFIDKKSYYVISTVFSDKTIILLIHIPEINSLIETLKERGYYAFVVDSNGFVIAHVNENIVQQGKNLNHYDFVRKGISGEQGLIIGEIDGKKYLFKSDKFLNTDYTLFLGSEFENAFAILYKFKKAIIYTGGFGIFSAILISLIISLIFTKPVKGIVKQIEEIKKGNYKISKFDTSIEEFQLISASLYDMAQKILDRETELKKIFDSSADCIAIVTKDGDILNINDAGVKMFGYNDGSEMLKIKTPQTYVNMADREKYLQEINEKGYIKNYEVPLKRKNGEIFYALISSSVVKDDNGNILFIVTTIKDITEKRKLQEQLFQAQKMESIGRLVGSIAHDFNNILSVIYGSVQLIKMHMRENSQIERYVLSIEKGVEKARDFIRKLLIFSKREPHVFKIYDLNEVIMEEVKIFKPTVREDINLELKLWDNPLFVNLDRSQLTQILLNLLVNSMDAMPQGGIIRIETEKKRFDYESIKQYPFVKEGDYACIVFSDTGKGIPDEIKDRIFEPFFTTKPEGTGLGLYTVYGIVQQHNGFINVYSEEGRGTTFKIYLPLIESLKREVEEEKEEIEVNIRKILVVEDNDDVRAVIEEILRSNGFEVVSFSDGLEFLKRFEELKDEVELYIFDIVMPKIGGFELYEKIKEIKTDVKVLFMTGYTDNISQVRAILDEDLKILNKPFSIEELKRKIKEF